MGGGRDTCFVFLASSVGLFICCGSYVTLVLFICKRRYQNNGEQANPILAYLAHKLKITNENY